MTKKIRIINIENIKKNIITSKKKKKQKKNIVSSRKKQKVEKIIKY